jgi:hypothetical protein
MNQRHVSDAEGQVTPTGPTRSRGYIRLSYPPPSACEQCGEPCEPFTAYQGWVCWDCLPSEDQYDADGKRPADLGPQQRADLDLIRDRLSPGAPRCRVCHERRAPSEMSALDGTGVCADCQALATRNAARLTLENTGLSRASNGKNAPGSTTSGDHGIHPHPDSAKPLDDSGQGMAA